MKLFSKSINGRMVRIGEDEKTTTWYYIDKIKDQVKDINIGEEVTILYDTIGGAFHLSFIAKGKVDLPQKKSTPKDEEKPKPETTKDNESPKIKSGYKAPPEQEKKLDAPTPPPPPIIAQTEMTKNVASITTGMIMISLQGRLDENMAIEAFKRVYAEVIKTINA